MPKNLFYDYNPISCLLVRINLEYGVTVVVFVGGRYQKGMTIHSSV